MWLSDRRGFLAGGAASLALAGCQFRPAMSDRGPAGALFGQVEIEAPGSPTTFLMTRRLEERLGRSASGAPYQLSYTLETDTDRLGTDRDGTNQRVHVTGRLRYTLRRRSDNAVLSRDEVRNFTGYSTTGNTVSTRAASADAVERLVVILADDLVERLLLASPDIPS
ncbi:LPS assembly lipoprotein LptE [Primorskyibacter sp. S187A]|uniref:LPS assembly lipoprotein LptE n=1 Tax=Primorskyibacter sp. S187A TaxID=3415130 RepID=UPI003C7BC87E